MRYNSEGEPHVSSQEAVLPPTSSRNRHRKAHPWEVDLQFKNNQGTTGGRRRRWTTKNTSSWKQQMQERKAVFRDIALPEQAEEEEKEETLSFSGDGGDNAIACLSPVRRPPPLRSLLSRSSSSDEEEDSRWTTQRSSTNSPHATPPRSAVVCWPFDETAAIESQERQLAIQDSPSETGQSSSPAKNAAEECAADNDLIVPSLKPTQMEPHQKSAEKNEDIRVEKDNAYYMLLFRRSVVLSDLEEELPTLYTSERYSLEAFGQHDGTDDDACAAKQRRSLRRVSEEERRQLHLRKILMNELRPRLASLYTGNHEIVESCAHADDGDEVPSFSTLSVNIFNQSTTDARARSAEQKEFLLTTGPCREDRSSSSNTSSLDTEEMSRNFSAFGIDLGAGGLDPKENNDCQSVRDKHTADPLHLRNSTNSINTRVASTDEMDVEKIRRSFSAFGIDLGVGEDSDNHSVRSKYTLQRPKKEGFQEQLDQSFQAFDTLLGGQRTMTSNNQSFEEDDERSVWTEYTTEELLETLVVAKPQTSGSTQDRAKSSPLNETPEENFQDQMQKSFEAFEALVGEKSDDEFEYDYDEVTVLTEYTTEESVHLAKQELPKAVVPAEGFDNNIGTKTETLIVDMTPPLLNRKEHIGNDGKGQEIKASANKSDSFQEQMRKSFMAFDALVGSKPAATTDVDEQSIVTECTAEESIHLAKQQLPLTDLRTTTIASPTKDNEKSEGGATASFQEDLRKSFKAFDALIGEDDFVEEEVIEEVVEELVEEVSVCTECSQDEHDILQETAALHDKPHLETRRQGIRTLTANERSSPQETRKSLLSDNTEATSATTNSDKSASVQVPSPTKKKKKKKDKEKKKERKEKKKRKSKGKGQQQEQRRGAQQDVHIYSPSSAKLLNSRLFSEAGLTMDHVGNPYITVVQDDDDDMTCITFDQSLTDVPQRVSEDETCTNEGASRASRASSSSKRVAEILRKDVWSRDLAVVQAALEQLCHEAAAGPEHRANIARFGGILAIFRAMEVNHVNVEIQIAGCRALEKMAVDKPTQVAIGEVGGMPSIVGVMTTHRDHVGVQQAACSALLNISRCCCGGGDKDDPIPTEGVVQALATAMKQHSDQVEIQVKAFGALGNLCVDNETRIQELAASGGLSTMTMALQQQWEHSTEKHEAISTMSILLRCMAGCGQ